MGGQRGHSAPYNMTCIVMVYIVVAYRVIAHIVMADLANPSNSMVPAKHVAWWWACPF